MSRRITIDIDTKNKLEVAHCMTKALIYVPFLFRLELTPSNSKGYHLIVWSKFDFTKEEIYKLRKKIGDDHRRIKNDRIRRIGEQTLFNKKYNL